MSTAFAFDNAPLTELSIGNYCAFPVSEIPAKSAVLAADVANIPGFVPVVLTGRNLTATGWLFDNFSYPFFNYTTNTVGFCVARMISGAPSPSDKLVCFNGYTNALDQDIVTPPGAFANAFTVAAPYGLLRQVPAYRYTAGSIAQPALATVPQGLMYLAGTRNNTVAWATPVDNTRCSVWRAIDGGNAGELYNRAIANTSTPDHILDMRTNRIRVGQIWVRCGVALNNVTWWGSNSIEEGEINSGNTSAIYNDNSRWTQITNSVNLPAVTWTLITTTNNTTFWGHLKFNSANTSNGVQEIEFGASTFQSTTINMAP